jgi:chromosome segregation ATPase
MDDSLKIELVKAQEAINHLKEAHKELKEHIKEIDRALIDKSEEIKDIFYLAETTRKSLEELSESVDVTFEKYDELFNKKEERKEKKVLGIVQALVTIAAVLYALFVKHGG